MRLGVRLTNEMATAGLLLAVAAAGVALTQPRVARSAYDVKEGEDVYALPPPGQLRAAVLGWNAAAVDLLWAGPHHPRRLRHPLVGAPRVHDHPAVRRRHPRGFEPTYQPLYRYIDTLLAYRPMLGTERDAKLARGYLERGTRERPDDSRLWNQYGQFLAFIGPSFLHDDAEKDRLPPAPGQGPRPSAMPSRWAGDADPGARGGDHADPRRLDRCGGPLPRSTRTPSPSTSVDGRGTRGHRPEARCAPGDVLQGRCATLSARPSTPAGRARCPRSTAGSTCSSARWPTPASASAWRPR